MSSGIRTRKEIIVTLPSGSSAAKRVDFGIGGTDEDGNVIDAVEALRRMGVLFSIGFLGDTAGMSTETLTVWYSAAPLDNDTSIDTADNYDILADGSGTDIVLDPGNGTAGDRVYGAQFVGPITSLLLKPSGNLTAAVKVVISWI